MHKEIGQFDKHSTIQQVLNKTFNKKEGNKYAYQR
nr:MAG TPA: Invasion protein B family [Microviridae sp.]